MNFLWNSTFQTTIQWHLSIFTFHHLWKFYYQMEIKKSKLTQTHEDDFNNVTSQNDLNFMCMFCALLILLKVVFSHLWSTRIYSERGQRNFNKWCHKKKRSKNWKWKSLKKNVVWVWKFWLGLRFDFMRKIFWYTFYHKIRILPSIIFYNICIYFALFCYIHYRYWNCIVKTYLCRVRYKFHYNFTRI